MAWERYLAVLQKIQAAGAWRPECPSMWVCWHGRYYHKIETFLLIFFLKRCGLSEQRNTYLYFLALNRAVNLELLTWPQLVWKKKEELWKKMVTCTNIDFVLQISLNNVDKTVLNLWHVVAGHVIVLALDDILPFVANFLHVGHPSWALTASSPFLPATCTSCLCFFDKCMW